ncbi:YggS family pyridoxal phosphate-dependent enzyme [Parabacteroides sp. FAFU027]|uniref:YggS family pyridoxal phosphate-dependent enzyme n=1 Tax=Parabacteroides sp. FAFU027 TaxID=2922715 RepID=UPI001FAFCB17|nr:YggS family pyridoxal phosphate-dependent enzyme [Parabacteroides sp. FAFU027]
MSVSENLNSVRQNIPSQVQLVAVSKFHPAQSIREAYECGQRVFGESRVQELTDKVNQLPSDIEWHFIGHLQTNKVKYIVPFVTMIHAIDSERLLQEIDKSAGKVNRTIDCLLQIHIAEEESKFGFSLDECREFMASGRWKQMPNIRLRGVMGMATFTDNEAQVRREFQHLTQFFREVKEKWFADEVSFSEISMGMSDDYRIAIEEGSTMVRIGSTIFGSRQY